MSSIQEVHARQVLDSRGNPTVEVEVALASGASGRAAAGRFRARVELAEQLAEADGLAWPTLPLDEQDAYFDRAKESA